VRQRYFVLASIAYLILGLIVIVRSVFAGAVPIGLFGLVLIALGAVRLRDYYLRESRPR
jgi:uncharacterized membrane protein HdeD (DUF308 family)